MSRKTTRIYHGGPANTGSGGSGYPPVSDRLVTPAGTLLLIAENAFNSLRFTAAGGANIVTDGDLMIFVAGGFDTYISGGESVEIDANDDLYLYSANTLDCHAGSTLELHAGNSKINLPHIKSGATQVGANALAGDLWRTAGHASLPDGVVMIGI